MSLNKSNTLLFFRRIAFGFLMGGIGVFACSEMVGCQPKAPELAPTKPPEVVIRKPFQQDIQEYEDFTGRTEAFRMAEVRARVTGYLEKYTSRMAQI